jgi:hypothetical protein
MRRHSARTLCQWHVAAIVGLLLLSGAAVAAENPMDCIEEITVPNAAGALTTYIPATVQVRILIGDNGRAASVDFGAAKPIFRLELGHYFSEGARYLKACQGKTITFTVRYVVRGEKTARPVSEVRFRPPNEFVVVCHPVEPALDPFPEPKPKSK